jgi:large subunit ribosomal protein L46
VATILERTPIIMPEPTPEEREFQQFRLLMANARARELPPELEKQLFGKSADGNADGVQLLDPELFEVDEDGEYEPAPRETDADRTNDRRSLNRKLDRWLFLVVRRKLGPTRRALWQFPQRNIEDVQRTPEGMHEPSAASTSSPVFFRAEAEKALHSFIETSDDDADENIVGSKEEEEGEEEPFEAHFIGNAPCAHLKHTYSAAFQNAQGIAGIKIFFYRAQLISGRVTRARSPAADDFAWVTADELPEYLPPEYYRAIAPVVW